MLRVPGLWWLVPLFYILMVSRLFGHPIYKLGRANRGGLSPHVRGIWPGARTRSKF
ncbi:MAG TPA: hypothetical protein VLJ17_22840 [Xanthobacteraceae bacterium]|nr:hypothetical protein [Xanthobacteraceae bacterium]